MSDFEDPMAIPIGYYSKIFDLSERVAVVTGGSSGLGEAISIGLAQAGMNIVLADINVEGAERVATTIGDQGGTAVVKELNVVDKDSCDRVADEVSAQFGHVDVLVNSAGSAFRCPAENFPEDKFDFIINLNVKGTYLCCQSFGRKMLAQGKGSIINIGSIGGFNAYPLASAYLASKGAVVQITRSLALVWRTRGVRVNGIGPTLMNSPLTEAAGKTTSITADFIKARMIRPRLGLPKELIGAAVFLASDASELVTGHMLMCDDGYLTS